MALRPRYCGLSYPTRRRPTRSGRRRNPRRTLQHWSRMMLTLTVKIEGKTDGDIAIALDEVSRLVSDGMRGGGNSNESGQFDFDIVGEEELTPDEDADQIAAERAEHANGLES